MLVDVGLGLSHSETVPNNYSRPSPFWVRGRPTPDSARHVYSLHHERSFYPVYNLRFAMDPNGGNQPIFGAPRGPGGMRPAPVFGTPSPQPQPGAPRPQTSPFGGASFGNPQGGAVQSPFGGGRPSTSPFQSGATTPATSSMPIFGAPRGGATPETGAGIQNIRRSAQQARPGFQSMQVRP